MTDGRICVVGAGVIGSLFAAHLSRVAEVWVLTRRAAHAAALESHGLRVSGRAAFTARLRATANAVALPNADLTIIATKGTQLEAAAAALERCVQGSVVVTVQNGLGAEQIGRAHV